MEAVLAVLRLHDGCGCPQHSRVAKPAAPQKITPDLRLFRQQQSQRLSGFESLDRLLLPFSLCEGDSQFPLMLPDSLSQETRSPFGGGAI